MAVRMDSFSGCCGIHILTNFGHTPTNPGGGEPDKADVERDIEFFEAELFHNKGLVLVALNATQKKIFGKTMEKFEFEPIVKDFYHPGHRSKITLYARKCYDEDNKRIIRKAAPDRQETIAKKALAAKRANVTATYITTANTGTWSRW